MAKKKYPRLIINGDDFGISQEANEAIVGAFKEGILTSCSLMASGEAFEQAVELARENAGLPVGIHLVTVMGKSVLPHEQIPSLVDQGGNFPQDPTIAGLRYYFSADARRELRDELEAQFAKFVSTGLRLSHVDSHLHLHVHPVVFEMALELAERYGARRMRVPADDLGAALRYDGSRFVAKSLEGLVFRLLTRRMKKVLRRRGFAFAEHVYGHFQSGRMTEDYVCSILEKLPASSCEMYFHPAYIRAGRPHGPSTLQGMKEFQILVAGRPALLVKRRGIELIDYSNLEKHP